MELTISINHHSVLRPNHQNIHERTEMASFLGYLCLSPEGAVGLSMGVIWKWRSKLTRAICNFIPNSLATGCTFIFQPSRFKFLCWNTHCPQCTLLTRRLDIRRWLDLESRVSCECTSVLQGSENYHVIIWCGPIPSELKHHFVEGGGRLRKWKRVPRLIKPFPETFKSSTVAKQRGLNRAACKWVRDVCGCSLCESSPCTSGPFSDAATLVPMLHSLSKFTSSPDLTRVESFLHSVWEVRGRVAGDLISLHYAGPDDWIRSSGWVVGIHTYYSRCTCLLGHFASPERLIICVLFSYFWYLDLSVNVISEHTIRSRRFLSLLLSPDYSHIWFDFRIILLVALGGLIPQTW